MGSASSWRTGIVKIKGRAGVGIQLGQNPFKVAQNAVERRGGLPCLAVCICMSAIILGWQRWGRRRLQIHFLEVNITNAHTPALSMANESIGPCAIDRAFLRGRRLTFGAGNGIDHDE